MTGDLLRDITQIGLVRKLGVPRIPVLRRYEPGAPLLDGPALVGVIGAGRFAEPIRALLTAAGVADAGDEGRIAAVVLDASAVRTIDELAGVQQFLTPTMRRLQPCGRVLLIAPEPDPADPEAAAVAQAFDGLVRSIGKELRAGATANLLVTTAETDPAALDPSVRFFLSARSAYVDGQVVHVGPPVGRAVDPAAAGDPAPADEPLSGRVALVTGAARGIGAAVAETLARDGATVVAIDVPAAGDALAKVANEIGGTALQLDITAPDAPQRIVAHLEERHGRVDVVVHNAGITRDKLLANMTADRWNAVLAVNLRAQLAINAALGEVLSDTARIVCVASTSGIAGNRGQTNYAASKAGVIGMVRALAPQLAPRGVTINAVAPGFIETEMTAKMPVATREAGRRINSLRQGGLPVDVAETIAWLARADNGGVTGQVVRVCGQSWLGA
ncbi:3-oxoacyl-[acyl-carrier protein] reductase [Pseudonocardia thermophila]|jgi:Dehydrogenases with different specificities (related to short-chain alcohol dehydrogenases)|uniref:3-oxoacyl-[acyl-carrier protein] reductase n=1 Tax=Pseudonocardia thermophila TaxID=1848 RepID=A0A1M6UJS9_PSETH|nr:3-oxoacyl-ACP reductase [Pseudonocardia thermophila]SHK69494.1 3-oxoacyl-[acyl-carrier protein] reductase [Pseudonocardia thermophila]